MSLLVVSVAFIVAGFFIGAHAYYEWREFRLRQLRAEMSAHECPQCGTEVVCDKWGWRLHRETCSLAREVA